MIKASIFVSNNFERKHGEMKYSYCMLNSVNNQLVEKTYWFICACKMRSGYRMNS